MAGNDALVTEDGVYRYWLRRWVGNDPAKEPRILNVIMLNPSTADADHNDPTIRRCIGFARAWRFSILIVTNLFAFRATNPRDLRDYPWLDKVGPDNDNHVQIQAYRADAVLAAWGTLGSLHGRDARVRSLLGSLMVDCLGRTRHGAPRHPLYVPRSTQPVRYW